MSSPHSKYKFSPEEEQKRAAVSSELKKKFLAKRTAAEGDTKAKKGAGEKDKKKVVIATPKIDFAAIKAAARDRRNFLAGTAAFSGAITITALGSSRFMFQRLLFEPPSTFYAGVIDDYLPDVPVFFKEFRTWIIRTPDRIYALSGRCTHLGCTPKYLSSERKFKCPCHGSGFRMNGINFEGPAPRALERFRISMDGGKLLIDKSKMFLFEKGEWEQPDSFILT